MNTSHIEVTLPAKDDSGKNHSFIITEAEGELQLHTKDGRKIASMHVSTMTKDVKDEEGDYHTKFSDNFYVSFRAEEAVAKQECDAVVWLEKV